MVHERKVLQANYFLAFFIFLCLASERYILLSWYLKKKIPWEFTQKTFIENKNLPFCSHIKTCAGHPQSWKASCHRNNFWYLWVWKTASCYGSCTSWSTSSMGSCAVGCKSCVLAAGKWDSEALRSFLILYKKVCWGMHRPLSIPRHLVYRASQSSPVILGPNPLSTPIPLAVLFSNQSLALFNSSCHLFLVFPLLLSCTSLVSFSFKYNTFFFHVAGTWKSFPGRKSLRMWLNRFDSLNSLKQSISITHPTQM